MHREKVFDAVAARQGDGQEIESRAQLFVRLRAAKPQEAGPGFSKTFAAEASHAESVVGPFEQIHRQPVRRDAQPIADLKHRWKRIKRARRIEAMNPLDRVEAGDQQIELFAK